METGKIGVTTENIFPIIKKFLYSDHEIFLRELISNAVDATQKLRTLATVGDYKGVIGDTTIRVSVDKKKKTIKVSDSGIGMTKEEVDKYLNQIAFSSANDFLDKYKDQSSAIIGHFGLGFYSSFMVSDKVEVITKSYQDGAQAVKWSCDGSPEFSIEDVEKENIGTDVILYIDKESKDFLEEEDYMKFYRELYPSGDDPLFYIHLNVDYPFKLTGILYFPKIKSNIEIQKNKIQLYSNQVFVTDSVEGIVPEFLTLLHGVIDSPDIPLNVSRSYLQSDSNVKKISNHITKKVADKLEEIFKANREEFQEKWDDIRTFIEYGIISEEKFYERAVKFALFKNTEGKYFTFDEYKTAVTENQTDKNKKLVYLYTTNTEEQHSYIQTATEHGYDVLVMDGILDQHFMNT